MNSDNSTPSTAAHSSKRRIVVAWVVVNLAFPSTNATHTSPVFWIIRRYETASISISDSSQNVCSFVRAAVFNALPL